MNSDKGLNFRVDLSTSENTDVVAFFDLARTYYCDRSELRGFNELLAEIQLYDTSKCLSQMTFFQAYSDDALCGLAMAYQLGNVIKIPMIIVARDFREIGIGDYIFSIILNSEQFKSATTFESQVLPGDRSAKNFFEQHHGKTRMLVVQGNVADAIDAEN